MPLPACPGTRLPACPLDRLSASVFSKWTIQVSPHSVIEMRQLIRVRLIYVPFCGVHVRGQNWDQ